jgi:hypothetical protein
LKEWRKNIRWELLDEEIKNLLEDIKTVYLIGYFMDDLTTEAEKWGQIQILEHILRIKSS